MDWTDEQLNAIRDSYWKERTAECPTCERRLEVHDEAVADSDQRKVVARCGFCKENWEITPSTDPLASQFRAWLADEKSRLLVQYKKQTLHCPVDESLLIPAKEAIGGSLFVGEKALVIRCGRCGQQCSGPCGSD